MVDTGKVGKIGFVVFVGWRRRHGNTCGRYVRVLGWKGGGRKCGRRFWGMKGKEKVG